MDHISGNKKHDVADNCNSLMPRAPYINEDIAEICNLLKKLNLKRCCHSKPRTLGKWATQKCEQKSAYYVHHNVSLN